MAFVRSGWVNVSTSYTGGVLNAGGTGYGWSRTAGSTTDAYTLAMGPTGVNPSSNHYRWLGYPLRCLYQSGATNIVKLPLAFVRGGCVDIRVGRVNYVGEAGYDWSRTAELSTYGWRLNFSPTSVGPSAYNDRDYGYPLRWLSKLILT